jgi:hypothetical protein
MLANTGIDSLNPQTTEITFPVTAVTIGVLRGFLDGLHRCPKDILPAAIIALRTRNNFFVTGVLCDAPFYTSHFCAPLTVGKEFFDDLCICVGQDHGPTRASDHLLWTFAHAMLFIADIAAHFPLGGQAETLLDPTFGLKLGHFSLLILAVPVLDHISGLTVSHRPGMPFRRGSVVQPFWVAGLYWSSGTESSTMVPLA